MLRNFKIFLIALIAVVVAGGAYAFAATNTVPDSAAGYKANVVPGYTVTDIVYDLNATNPTLVDAITFDIEPSSGSVLVALVKVQTVNTTGTWKECTLGSPTLYVTPITCTYDTPTLNLIDVDALNIVASSSLDPAP